MSIFIRKLNFYRIHLLGFTLLPILSAVILWASNGQFHIKFIDSLFICISAATGTGLTTIDLSSLTVWQQVIIMVLEIVGNQACVAWIVVLFRKWFFRKHLEHIVIAEHVRGLARDDMNHGRRERLSLRHFDPENLNNRLDTGIQTILHRHPNNRAHHTHEMQQISKARSTNSSSRLRTDMVRRADIAPYPVNPVGIQTMVTSKDERDPSSSTTATLYHLEHSEEHIAPRTMIDGTIVEDSVPMAAIRTDGEFGGFPGPRELASTIIRKTCPSLHQRLQRTVTMPLSETLIPSDADILPPSTSPSKRVPYISFRAIVGRNSAFHGLSETNIEELGGVEYRALTALLWIVPAYYFGILFLSFVVIAPYMGLTRWKDIFLPPQQHRIINPTWFSLFQVVGAWANTGMSLVDQNMIPFKQGYLLIVILIVCVLAGNTAFPVFFRFTIWILTKLLPGHSRTTESLHFLLDHPRRCFIFLFPSRQTWMLLGIILFFNFIDWFFGIVLNIDNPATDTIPIGNRIFLSILQAASVRSAGFQSVPVSSLFPAVQVLYVIMMYIAIYPIAMSVRATNVYEERSLGVYEEEKTPDELQDEEDKQWNANQEDSSRVAIWGKYMLRHARRQLSFDMWWLALSLFILCIIERKGLADPQNAAWFNVFALIFELVSAYGTVGLSLGFPLANYSFSGALHVLSKLVICIVMLRGRHRGLPVALDRSIMLPHELQKRTIEEDSQKVADNGRGPGMRHDPQPPEDIPCNQQHSTYPSAATVGESS